MMISTDATRYAGGKECLSEKALRRYAYLDPEQVDEEDVRHLERCQYCRQVLHEQDNLARLPISRYLKPWRATGVGRVTIGLVAILPAAANTAISLRLASSETVATLDWWRLWQAELVRVGGVIGVALLVACGLWTLVKSARSIFRVALAAAIGLILVSGGMYAYADLRERATARHLDKTFISHRWVLFESPDFDPEANPDPSQDVQAKQLRWLREQGNFDGLVTFQFTRNLVEAARAADFRAVIVGIYVPPDGVKPVDKIKEAIAYEQETRATGNPIVGYSIGHNVPVSVPLDDLAKWMEELRRQTGKPVTSTFPLVSYLGERGRAIRTLGDWYFPDVHASWQFGTSPEKALEETRRAVEQATVLADKPVMLKMVSYPSGPDLKLGLSEQAQLEFYRGLTRDLYLPAGMHLSVFCGTDLPWKGKRPDLFAPSEQYVGLFKANGEPKPALQAVSGGAWPVQSRP